MSSRGDVERGGGIWFCGEAVGSLRRGTRKGIIKEYGGKMGSLQFSKYWKDRRSQFK